ncbi:LexA family protein [Streptomyces lasiicapitis]|uniref:LexA family protein n=1 Tax=Streptomyces lasiicapitis TaxID=1923961 RepID=UPI003661BD85
MALGHSTGPSRACHPRPGRDPALQPGRARSGPDRARRPPRLRQDDRLGHGTRQTPPERRRLAPPCRRTPAPSRARPRRNRPGRHRPPEAPSLRELAEAAGLSTPSSAHYQLKRIRKQGVIVETRGRPSGRCPYCER